MADLVEKLEKDLHWSSSTESSDFHIKLLIIDSPKLVAPDGSAMEPNITYLAHLFNKDTVVAVAAPLDQVNL